MNSVAAGGTDDMSSATPRGVRNSEVLTIAGLAAGAVGGIVIAVVNARVDRRQPVSRLERVSGQLRDRAARHNVGGTAADRVARATAAVQAGLPVAQVGGPQLGQRARQEAQRATTVVGKRARGTQSTLARQLEKRGEVAGRASSVVDDLTKQSRKTAQQLLRQSETYVAQGIKRAREAGATASDSAQHLLPEVRQRVEKQVLPTLQVASEDASSRAQELYEVARERATEARRAAEKDVLPAIATFSAQARDTIADLSEQARESIAETSQRLGLEPGELGERLTEVSGVATERASELGRRAQVSTKHAAEATAEGGKNLGSSVIWLSIGGAIVYYAFLDEEQRERAKRIAQRVFTEVRAIYEDIQGEDEAFT